MIFIETVSKKTQFNSPVCVYKLVSYFFYFRFPFQNWAQFPVKIVMAKNRENA